MKKRIIPVFLLTLCLMSLFCACGLFPDSTEFATEADNKVKVYLDYMAEQNVDAMYDMLYPGTVERDSFEKINEQMAEYCPLTKDYQINRTSYNVHSQFGNEKRKTVQSVFDLTFDEKEYVLITVYTIAGEECGFTKFQVITRAEYEAANKQTI